MTTTELDAVGLGIVWDRLISITNEVLGTLVRTSFSTNVRESYDLSCMLFDVRGRLIAQGDYSVPSFTGTAPATVQKMMERFPPDSLRPGDVIATNDPWIGTGHLYDINVLRPIFVGGRLVAFSMSITHLPDIGGLGFSTTAREVYEEGLRLPICKLVSAGQPNAPLLELIKENVRVPEQTIGDLYANIACNEVGDRLVAELMDEYAISDLSPIADAIIDSSESAIRAKVREIPDGLYEHSLQMEGQDEAITLAVRLDLSGDTVHADFTGTSEAVSFGINVPLSYAKAFVIYAVKCVTAPAIPNNSGCVNPITVSAPENCILNALPPSPTGGRHVVGHFVAPLVFGALAKTIPDRIQADSGMLNLINVQGRNRNGDAISSIYFASGGYGAFDGMDGLPTLPSPSNMTGTPIEIWESLTGMTVRRKSLIADSGGPGRYRGGQGQEVVLENTSGHDLTISCLGGRTEFPALGVAGGWPGSPRQYLMNGRPLESKDRFVLEPGDILTLIEAGGAGFGSPRDREPSRVAADVLMGAVTTEAALRDYGVDVSSPSSDAS